MISEQQMLNHDYDWFCIINRVPVCVASNGSQLPTKLNVDNNIINMQNRAYNLPRVHRFTLNRYYLEQHVVNTGLEYVDDLNSPYRELLRPRDIKYAHDIPLKVQYYAEHFAKMAQRGFYVFDKRDDMSNTYFLVAWPDRFDMDRLRKCLYRDTPLSIFTDELDFATPHNLINVRLLDIVERGPSEIVRDRIR